MPEPTAAVAGQLARDLVLSLEATPDAGSAADASARREQLGGKGANQAVALAQLGVRPQLVAVAGDDVIGDALLDQARRDGIGTAAVVRRAGTLTGLIVELLEEDGSWRYVQHLPEEVLLTAGDVQAARSVLEGADAVLVQLQQPAEAALAAAEIGRAAGRLVVLDGVPDEGTRARLLAAADVLRADEQEAELLLGGEVTVSRAREVLAEGPKLVAFGVPEGNLFVWADGELRLPLTDEKVADTTGGGDAFTAALTAALLRGAEYPVAARWAVAASGMTVVHPGGRPGLTVAEIEKRVEDIDG